MRVYVAGKFERVAEVREIQERLRADGHEIVADWTGHSAAGLSGVALEDYLRDCAESDAAGVKVADALVLLHDDNCRGGFTEFGIALGAGKLVAVIGGRTAAPTRGPIFYFSRDVHHFGTAEEVAAWLRWMSTPFGELPKVPAPAVEEDIA